MFRNRYLILLLWTLLLATAACTKKGDTGPAGPAGPAGTGGSANPSAIYGHVRLYDQYGTRVLTGLDKVMLTLNTGAYTFADSSGYYIFPALAAGDYSITGKDNNGFGTTIVNNVTVSGDTLYRDVSLSQKPTFHILSLNATYTPGSNVDYVSFTVTPDTRSRSCLLFVGTTPAVSCTPGTYLLAYNISIRPNVPEVIFYVPVYDLNAAGIFYGQVVYFAAYANAVNDQSVYEDEATGFNVYTAVDDMPVTDTTTCP